MKARKLRGKISNLDPGIAEAVWVLRENGIDTCQSCQGGPGHAYSQPTVAFTGSRKEAFRAAEIVRRPEIIERIGMRPADLSKSWSLCIVFRQMGRGCWELTWWPNHRSGAEGWWFGGDPPNPNKPPVADPRQPGYPSAVSSPRPGIPGESGRRAPSPSSSCDKRTLGHAPTVLPACPVSGSPVSSLRTPLSPREDDGMAPDPSQVKP
jgi:hypothetical protein